MDQNKQNPINLTPEQQKDLRKDEDQNGVPDLVDKQLENMPGFLQKIFKFLVKSVPTNPNMRIRDEKGNIIQMPAQPVDPVGDEERKEKARTFKTIFLIIDAIIVGGILYYFLR